MANGAGEQSPVETEGFYFLSEEQRAAAQGVLLAFGNMPPEEPRRRTYITDVREGGWHRTTIYPGYGIDVTVSAWSTTPSSVPRRGTMTTNRGFEVKAVYTPGATNAPRLVTAYYVDVAAGRAKLSTGRAGIPYAQHAAFGAHEASLFLGRAEVMRCLGSLSMLSAKQSESSDLPEAVVSSKSVVWSSLRHFVSGAKERWSRKAAIGEISV